MNTSLREPRDAGQKTDLKDLREISRRLHAEADRVDEEVIGPGAGMLQRSLRLRGDTWALMSVLVEELRGLRSAVESIGSYR